MRISYAAVPSMAREQPGVSCQYKAGLAADGKHLVHSLKKDLKAPPWGKKNTSIGMRLKEQRQAANWGLAAEAY